MSGRKATTNIIPGNSALSVGLPNKKAPKGWGWVPLNKVATMATGHTPSRKVSKFWGGDIQWMSVKDARPYHGSIIYETTETTNQLGIDNSAAVVLPKGTVCLSRTGSIGYSVLLGKEMATSQGFVNWICGRDLLPRFLQYIFVAEKSFLLSISEGVAHTTIYFPEAKAFHICIPPVELQTRIVAEIEKQFSRLDEIIAKLKRIQTNLKRYKAAVLKAAVEGKLTEQWRKNHPDIEPAEQLLKRILAERRAKWESEELAKMKAKQAKPKDDSWKSKYNEPVGPDTANLSELPEGWVWARAEQLCGFITKGTTPAANKLFAGEGNIPFIKVYNLTHHGLLDFSVNPTFIADDTHRNELARSKVLPGDVLMNIVGPPLGKVSLVPDKYQEWNINQAVAIYRPVLGYDRKFLCHCLLTESVLSWATKRAKATAGQFNLTLELCRDLPLPLPPLKEQASIVEEIDRRLSVTEELEATIETNLKRAERLRQTILQQAFSGGLV